MFDIKKNRIFGFGGKGGRGVKTRRLRGASSLPLPEVLPEFATHCCCCSALFIFLLFFSILLLILIFHTIPCQALLFLMLLILRKPWCSIRAYKALGGENYLTSPSLLLILGAIFAAPTFCISPHISHFPPFYPHPRPEEGLYKN